MFTQERFLSRMPKQFLLLSLLLFMVVMFAACAGFDRAEQLADEPPAVTEEESMAGEEPVEEAPLSEEPPAAEETAGEEEAAPGTAEPLIAVRASGLMDHSILSNAMTNLGEVEDVIIDLEGSASYVLISPGIVGDVDANELLVLPLAALRYSAEDEMFVFAGDEETFQAAPRLVGGERPDLMDPAWDRELVEFWNNASEVTLIPETGDTAEAASVGPASILASDLIGDFVVSENSENVGRIEDVIISIRDDNVDYAVLSFAGYASILDRFFAIPMSHLDLAGIEEDMVGFDVEEETLQEAPAFNPEEFPNINFPEWDSEFLVFWESAAIAAASGTGQLGSPAAPPTGLAGPAAPIADEFALSISELLDYNVTNEQGEELGQVEDLILGLHSNSIVYAVLTLENLPGSSGDELIPVPLVMTNIETEDETFIFNLDPVIAAAAPRFSRDNWPDLSQEEWSTSIWEFWTGPAVIVAIPPGAPAAAPVPAPDNGEELSGDPAAMEVMPGVDEPAIRLSEVLDYAVVNAQGQNLGQVEDMIMEVATQRANYLILAFDGAVNLDVELMPIPWSALILDSENQTLALDLPEQTLQRAPGFNRAEWAPDTTDQDWDAAIRDFWLGP